MSEQLFVETIKVKDGLFYNLPFHIERMQRTAMFHYNATPTLELSAEVIPTHLQSGLLKCRVIYSADIQSVEFEPYQFRRIASLALVECNEVEYKYKSTDRDILSRLKSIGDYSDDIIIVKNGELTDTSYSNLVFEDMNGDLFTPRSYLLAGTKRRLLLQNGTITERPIKPVDIPLFRKVYLINAMIDIEDDISCPVSSIILNTI